MGIKTYRPYTPSRRHMTGSDFSEITKTTPEKSLVVSLSKTAGRNNQGKITVRHRGGGVKRKYRVIDFKRKKDGIPATVIGIEYDPNRSANIALICYADGEKAYIIAPEGLTDGMKVMNGPEAEVRVGNCLPLSAIPVGTQVHNIELHPGKGGQMVRSAGNSAKFFEGDVKGSCKMQLDAIPLIEKLFCEVNPIPVKKALNLMGWQAGPLRMPLTEMTEAHTAQLAKELEAFGIKLA